MAGTSNTHQRASAAEDISENHASQLGISYQLVGQGLVGTQPLFMIFFFNLIPIVSGLFLHDTL